MIKYAGLDVHKRVVEACVLDAEGQILMRERFDLSPSKLSRFARRYLGAEAKVAVEATTNTWAIVRLLKPHVGEVVVSNPLATKAIAQAKVKTDKVDALVLAQLLRCDYLPRVWQPDEATQEIRRLTSRRAALVGQATGVKNRLHAILAQRLLAVPVPDLFNSKGLAWLGALELDGEGRLMLDSDLRLLRAIHAEISALDTLLAQKGYQDERIKLLMTLPGVDITCAQAVLAALGDIGRFRDADHAASYLGLVPSTRQSADHCYHGPITKAGNGQARWMLVQASQHLGKHPGPLGVFFRRLKKRKNHNVAVVAAARKLVTIAWHMLTRNEPYRYAQPHPTMIKLARLRIKATGARRKPQTKGKGRSANYGSGVQMRTIKPLTQVFADEDLPPLGPAPAGEARTIAQSDTTEYVASLTVPHIVPRRQKQPTSAPTQA
jgi:transposase